MIPPDPSRPKIASAAFTRKRCPKSCFQIPEFASATTSVTYRRVVVVAARVWNCGKWNAMSLATISGIFITHSISDVTLWP